MAAEKTGNLKFHTASESETETLGKDLGLKIQFGMCISLVGALGTGKTVLARGLCRGLGVEEMVLSPTFILYEEFQGRLPVVHLDLYRLEHESEIEELGVFEKVGGHCVLIAEWGDRSELLSNASDLVITLIPRGDTIREINMDFSSKAGELFRQT